MGLSLWEFVKLLKSEGLCVLTNLESFSDYLSNNLSVQYSSSLLPEPFSFDYCGYGRLLENVDIFALAGI